MLDAARDFSGGYNVDASRGGRNGRVSSEWFSHPADERYLSLSDRRRARSHRTEPDAHGGERGDPGGGEPR